MRLKVCFEAGRQTQTESSARAPSPMRQMDVWSRDPLAQRHGFATPTATRRTARLSPATGCSGRAFGGTASPLDKNPSWMSHLQGASLPVLSLYIPTPPQNKLET